MIASSSPSNSAPVRSPVRLLAAALVLGLGAAAASPRAAPVQSTVALRTEYGHTLAVLVDRLEAQQLPADAGADAGALQCPHCGILHTRAAESVWPFAMRYRETGDRRHLDAARAAAAWLFRQQQADGCWKETPEEWTGTTTDQLLMLALAYREIGPELAPAERAAWLGAMERAADYLARVMTPEFASINYVATTTATLAAVHQIIPRDHFLATARALAHQTVARFDEEGFLDGEGGKCHDIKRGVDLGYSLEMSLWGLGYYARLTGDQLVDDIVRRSLRAHLPFIYPDGMMDGSWGIRSNKWTTFGSATSDGCQVLFQLYADDDPAYATAAWRNLAFLRTQIHDGLVHYGPHHALVMRDPPCLYPTFAKAKNLALAMLLETRPERPLAALPIDTAGWHRHFPTLDVVVARTRAFAATVTAYGYRDIAKGADSKYMFRPAGGSLSCLWLEGHGLLQAGSQTEYHRWEPMHFPAADDVRSLTPRIEYRAGSGYFTNLFEFDARLTTTEPAAAGAPFTVSAAGELKDRRWHYGGVSYRLTHRFHDDVIEKEVTLHYRGAAPAVAIVEPIVHHAGMSFEQLDDRTVRIRTASRTLRFRLLDGKARLVVGRDAAHYWSAYPALRAYPLELVVAAPGAQLRQTIRYELALEPPPAP